MDSNHRHQLSESCVLPLNDPASVSGAHAVPPVRRTWLGGADSNCRSRLQRPASWPLNDLPAKWGDRRELNPRGQIHSLPPKPLGHGHAWCQEHESNVLRSFQTSSAFQTGALTATASLAKLVEEEGIEPSFAGCRPAVLPLNDSPKPGCGLAS